MKRQGWKQLTLFPEDSLVNRLALPGSEEAKKMTVISGQKCSELSRRSNQLGCLEKMLLDSSIWASTKRYLTWRAKGISHDHFLFQLVPSVPCIKDTEYLLWPTPRANDAVKRGDIANNARNGLPAAVLYPTPKARDYRTGSGPQSVRAKRRRAQKRSINLNDFVLLPTPRANDAKNSCLCPSSKKIDSIPGELARSGISGQLNPLWVEWLMGFPPGWTDLSA